MTGEEFTLETDDRLVGALVADRYKILRKLGEGGMGSVYAAEHAELGRKVAIKVIHPRMCREEEAVKRFLQEARTASQIGHPNVVDVFDLGRLPDNRPFMVMPLLRGIDCEDMYQDRGPQSPAKVAELLRGAAAGLDALHALGLVHRDIKPANIFLSIQDDGHELTKIMDFGLAALQRVGSRLTEAGTVLGTPHYLPPECAGGTKADIKGDVYSLAVVAYEFIAGELPFDSENPTYLLAMKMTQDAPKLSKLAPQPITPELDAFFAASLSRKPEGRPESCGAFVDELARLAQGMPRSVQQPKRTSELAFTFSDMPSPVATKQPEPLDIQEAESDPSERETLTAQRVPRVETQDSIPLPVRRKSRNAIVALVLLIGVAGTLWWVFASGSVTTREESELAATEVANADPVVLEPTDAVESPEPAVETSDESVMVEESETVDAPRNRMRQRRNVAMTLEREQPESPDAEDAAEDAAEETPDPSEATMVAPMQRVAPAVMEATTARQDRTRAAELTNEANRLSLAGRLPAAAEKYREATLTAPSYAPAWRGLGIANERMNRTADALRAFRRYVRIAPNAPDAPRIQSRIEALE